MKLKELFEDTPLRSYAQHLRSEIERLKNDPTASKLIIKMKKGLHDLMSGRSVESVKEFVGLDDEEIAGL
jgi:hypothetical protein